MSHWLYQRFKAERKDWHPEYALRNSIRWPIALSHLCDKGQFETHALKSFYLKQNRRPVNPSADNLVFDAVLMALHNLSALTRIRENPNCYIDLVRSATIAWYYGVYHSASAMIAAAQGERQESHAKTARAWGNQLVNRGAVVEPFCYSTTTLVKKGYESEIDMLKNGNEFSLNNFPEDDVTSFGGAISYLKGTANRSREKHEEIIKASNDFNKLGCADFRKSIAKEFRDKRLSGKQTNFIDQAIRYRGKANYRDSIYLSYGQDRSTWIAKLVPSLEVTLKCFLSMACQYAERRVEKGVWEEFCDDLVEHCLFRIDADTVKGE
ncbi:MAG: hypothetical protein KOO63_01845 [Bacteroidales bacterium]|nr:hypothetical protein [Candidatus Latescibacterota bacterium]